MIAIYPILLIAQLYFWTYFWSLPEGLYDNVHVAVTIVALMVNSVCMVMEFIYPPSYTHSDCI